MATFHLWNFGCRASQADGAALRGQLRQAGFEETAAPESSDITVLNTCTVTAAADAEVRQVIRRIHRANPRCRILVTGCYAQRAPEEIASLDGVAWVVGNSHKHTVAGLLAPDRPTEAPGQAGRWPEPCGNALVTIQAQDHAPSAGIVQSSSRGASKVLVGQIGDEFHFVPALAGGHTRPTLKIQDGCNARCSFCIIPAVRGASRSLAPVRVVEEVRRLTDQGYKELVLSGINLGSYGKDLEPRLSFLGLVERLLGETTIQRLRISSIEPMDVSPALIRLLGSEGRLARHLHVPLQSGCDRILRLMNRRYWTRQYAERILAVREVMPEAAIGADVMVGFPGETPEDHAASLRFIESLPFTYLHIFPYSQRPSTPAAGRSHQINGRVAQERSRQIQRVIAAKHRAFLELQVGRTISVVTLEREGHSGGREPGRQAMSTNYLNVILPAGVAGNVLLPASIGRTDGEFLYGYPAGSAPAVQSGSGQASILSPDLLRSRSQEQLCSVIQGGTVAG